MNKQRHLNNSKQHIKPFRLEQWMHDIKFSTIEGDHEDLYFSDDTEYVIEEVEYNHSMWSSWIRFGDSESDLEEEAPFPLTEIPTPELNTPKLDRHLDEWAMGQKRDRMTLTHTKVKVESAD